VHPWRDFAVVFAVALGVRLVHLWQMRDTVFFSVLMGDSRGYDTWARQIAAGDWFGRDVFYQAPLYPYFLGTLYAAFGRDLLAVRIVQAFLGAAGCVALSFAVTRLVSARAGLLAGLMLALYPPAIFFDGLIQKSVLDVLLIAVVTAVAAQIIASGDSRGRWLALGVAVGALALTRENAIVLAAVLGLFAAIGSRTVREQRSASVVPATSTGPAREFRRARGEAVAAFVAGLAVVLLPVAARNYGVGGGFYLTTSQFGSNWYIGNNARADGSYMSLREGRGSPEYERLDATELAEQAAGRRLTPAEVSSFWTNETLAYITSQPGDWLRLLARKTRLLVSSTEVIDTESQESHEEYSSVLRTTSAVWHFGVLLPLGVLGMTALWPRRHTLWPLYALAATYALSVVAFFVVARYRLPLAPLLIVFAAAGIGSIVHLRWGLVAALAVAIVANWPLHTAASQQAITENNLGAALQDAGRLPEAIEHYRRALAFDASYTPAMTNLGAALRASGRLDEAVATYDAAVRRSAGSGTLHVNRGNALMQQGRITDAIAAFRQAVAVNSGDAHARMALARALYDQGTEALDLHDLRRATASFEEAIQVQPDYAEAHNNLGIALASQGRLSEAVKQWETALRLNPDLTDARRNLEIAR
jgi:tetratricopeptide (TPR) repeat protein